MKRLKITAILGSVALFLSVLTSPLMAGSFGVGASGIGAYVELSGKETLKGASVAQTAKEDAMVLMGEVYAQYSFDNGFAIGVGHIPGTSDLGTRNATRSDKRGSQTEVVTKKLNTASAEISDFYSIYVETPGYGSGNGQGIFLKAASNQMTVNTTETLETGSSYGEDEVTGYTLGLGWKGSFSEDGKGLHAKFIAEYSDFDTLSFKGSADDASEFSTITADSETYGLKISLGYNF